MERVLRMCLAVAAVMTAAAQPPALRKGVSVQMPVTTSATAVPDADQADSIVIAVTARGTVYFEITAVTPPRLTERVQAALAAHPRHRVYVKVDARTSYATMGPVLVALQKAGVSAPILLTDQHDAPVAGYVTPKGIEVQLQAAPGAATLKVSDQTSDAELKRTAQGGRPVVLSADGAAPFGDVAHAVDVCHGAGAKVSLAP